MRRNRYFGCGRARTITNTKARRPGTGSGEGSIEALSVTGESGWQGQKHLATPPNLGFLDRSYRSLHSRHILFHTISLGLWALQEPEFQPRWGSAPSGG